jgi:alpha-methylacyl-CoA racemase
MPGEDRDLLHGGKRVVDLEVKKDPQAVLDLAEVAENCAPGAKPIEVRVTMLLT